MIFLASGDGMGNKMLVTPKNGDALARNSCTVWGADNEAYSGGFDPDRFFPWLERMKPFRDACLFVAVPDVVGNSIATLELYREWATHFHGYWPLAFVAQDGQENLPLPDYYDTLFVGGTTEWRLSPAAVSVIRRAQSAGKHIHIGRVNWGKRYRYFRMMKGSDSWTCDGTRARFDGRDNTKRAWASYMAQAPLFYI